MPTLSELTAQILVARLAKKEMTLEEMQNEMAAISKTLKSIDEGTLGESKMIEEAPIQEEPAKPQKINFKKIFKDNEVICLICNKGFKTLKRHLTKEHGITDKEYRAQFNIPKTQPLVAKAYSEERKKMAQERGLGQKMVEARAAKKSGKTV